MSAILFENARIVDADIDVPKGWLTVENGLIANMGEGDFNGDLSRFTERIDASGKILMPGAIDEHVHFREPGLTHKADIASESMAAAAGGITSFFDMPNTKPMTVSEEAWLQKMEIAARKSVINYAFFMGAQPDNLDVLRRCDYRRIPGIKLFMGATTGAQATAGDDFLDNLFMMAPATIAVHAEDESIITANREAVAAKDSNPPVWRHPDIRSERACVEATRKIIEMARKYAKRLHIMHISTAAELNMLGSGYPGEKLITAETCPQYLLFSRKDYALRGTSIKCNPAIKEESDLTALLKAVKEGIIDAVGTDHAPHLLEEKQGNAFTSASGMPGVQFALPLMLTLARRNNMSLSDISRVMAANPAIIWNVDRRGFLRSGYHADIVLVEKTADNFISNDDVVSKCGWTPYAGLTVGYAVAATWVNGVKVFDSKESVANPHSALAIEFNRK